MTEKGRECEEKDDETMKGNSEHKQRNRSSYYVVSESLPLLLLEGLTEALDELVQFLGVAAQELPDILHVL